MDFDRLFTISAFEGLRLIRALLDEMPQIGIHECADILKARSPQSAPFDLEAAIFIHPVVPATAPFDSVFFYRQCVMSVMVLKMPAWAKLMTLGRGRFIKRLRSEDYRDIKSVFREARLLDEPPSKHDISWWDTIQARVRQNFDEERLARARDAEELSLNFEKKELEKLGIQKVPVWMAIEDNTVGYDVLSYRQAGESLKNLLIEVKSTVASPLRFILSRNEWDNADEIGDAYLFHVWDMSKSPPVLHIRTVQDVRPHIPKDNSKGKWKNTEIPVTSS